MTKNPYHKFLIKHRVYCEKCTGPMPATHVMKLPMDLRFRGKPRNPKAMMKDTCLCDAHFRAFNPIQTGLRERGRLEAR